MPLFPGESDQDQLYLILKCFGRLSEQQMAWLHRHPACVAGWGLVRCARVCPLVCSYWDQASSALF